MHFDQPVVSMCVDCAENLGISKRTIALVVIVRDRIPWQLCLSVGNNLRQTVRFCSFLEKIILADRTLLA